MTQTESELWEQIKGIDNNTLMKGKDADGVPYLQHIFKLHLLLFGEACEGCPGEIPGYINRIKKFKKPSIMENKEKTVSNFELNAGVIIPIRGTSDVVSQHNITDEKAIAILAENPAGRKALFKKLPDNVDELIKAHKAGDKSAMTNSDKDMVVIGIHKVGIDAAKAILEKAGVSTKATTVDGFNARIAKLKPGELTALINVAEEFVSADTASTTDNQELELRDAYRIASEAFNGLPEGTAEEVLESAKQKMVDSEKALTDYLDSKE